MLKTLFQTVPITRAERTTWSMNEELVPAHKVNMAAEVDATAMHRIREEAKVRGETAPSYTAFVIRAAARTMSKNPTANRAILGPPLLTRLVQFNCTDISVAVEKSLPALPGQAFASPIRNPLERSLSDVTLELRELSKATAQDHPGFRLYMRILKFVPRPFSTWMIGFPRWSPSAWIRYRGCAAWVNSPARDGADLVFATWPWPISFSFGLVRERAVVVNGEVRARLTMPILLAFDRRIMGGGPGSRLLADFKSFLENPE